MNDHSATIKLLKRISTVLIIAVAAGVLSALTLAPPVRADSPIFVRPGGDDLFCNGTANQDYSPAAAPACAVKTLLRAIELAGPTGQVMRFTGSETIPISLNHIPPDGFISAMAVTTLTVTKSDFPDPVSVDTPLTYTIVISNIGPSNASGVILDDLLPLSGTVTFKSASPGCILLPNNQVQCSLGTVSSSGAVVTIVVTTTAAGTINNIAVVRSPDAVSVTDEEETQVLGTTELSISKTDFPDPVVVGTPLTYTLVVSNSGPAAAATARLTDTLPASVLTGSFPPGCTYSAPTLTCNLGFLAVNTSTTISFVVTPTVVGVITNTAGITVSGGASDPIPGNNLVTQTTQVIAPANLIITKTLLSTAVSVGKVTTFTISYQNLGPFTATGVVITDFLASNVNYITDTLGSPPFTTPTTVRWNLPDLGLGQSGSFNVGLNLNPSSCFGTISFTNTVQIAAAQFDLNPTNNISVAGSGAIPCDVDLVVVKNDGIGAGNPITQAVAGGYVTYTISVNNLGGLTANNVVLTETLPTSTTFVGPAGWSPVGTNTYTYNIGSLASGSGRVVSFTVQVNPTLPCTITQIVNTVQAGSSGPEVYSPDNTSVEQTPVVCGSPLGQLRVQKDDGVICAAPNQTITYTITYSNSGGAAVNNVFLTDIKPSYTNFLPGDSWVDTGGGVFTRALGTVNPGGPQGPIYFRVQLVDRTAIPTSVTAITNVIQISGGDTYTEVTSVPLTPDLVVAKNDNIGVTSASSEFAWLYQQVAGVAPSFSAQAVNVGPGDFIEYTVVYVNNGRTSATNVVLTDTLPLYTTYAGGPEWTPASGQLYRHTVGNDLNPGEGGFLTFRVQVTNTLPLTLEWIINRVDIGGNESSSECNPNNSFSYEQTPVNPTSTTTNTIYLPIILKSDQTSPPPPPLPPPTPLAYVSDVKADPDTNQIFIASPRHDWVYVIDGSSDTITRNVSVGNGPTGLTVLDGSVPANNKVFVAHQYGANNWHPGFMAFGVNDVSAHNTADGGYAGAAPIKTAANAANNSRVYVSNYFDKLAVFNGNSGPPETRLGWVVQKAFQGAYGLDVSSATNRVYLATRDTGELVVFDGNNDRLLQANYIPTHVKPPQACSLWSVAVNETTGHVFVPCPQLGKVYVLQENQVSILGLEALGVLEERDGNLALVVFPQAAPWIAEITVSGGVGLGEEGIAVNTSTGRVFITNAQNNTLVVLQDGGSPAYVTTVGVGTRPQGVDVNPVTQKVYVGNTGSNNVTVLNANSPFTVTKTIQLTP